ncbi:hypothetical protein LVQ77_21185 [Buttiauxella sp. S04-F03]|uniref:hypothetical protein n=1 Tax=Buttiauxella sp. W03-F01 TaxID=2904524 RepID=UPI001E5A61BA|nr:hypothetical protein [Buttiauxella sp. W03-F01]MCE0802781.1 hypothetical protein [Buttiauxella sp. W03-F01]
MLSSISLTWFDVLKILVLIASPYILGAVILFLVIRSLTYSDSRKILLWLVLPQILVTLILWWGLNFYEAGTTFSILLPACITILGGIVVYALLFNALQSTVAGLAIGHLVALALFFGVFNSFNPNLFTEVQTGRDMHQLRDIAQSSKAFNRQLEDTEFRQDMLVEAVDRPDMPEATFRGLLARGANPFQTYAFNGSIFSTAVEHHNLNALRVFIEQLDGDNEQAENNRAFLLKNNPLEQHFYFSVTPTEEQKQQYKTTVKVILDKMPELLSDGVYARILPEANAELIQFLWGYHPPEKSVYRIQAEAMLGMVIVADKIAATPEILKEKPAAEYSKSLWEYLVQYTPRPVLQAILERNVVQWADYKDKDGNNPVLEAAIGRAGKYNSDDPQVLTIVMRDILEHSAPWSPSQLAHGFYTDEEGSHVVSALHSAGITCTQLREALSNFLKEDDGYLMRNGTQRIGEVCGAKK